MTIRQVTGFVLTLSETKTRHAARRGSRKRNSMSLAGSRALVVGEIALQKVKRFRRQDMDQLLALRSEEFAAVARPARFRMFGFEPLHEPHGLGRAIPARVEADVQPWEAQKVDAAIPDPDPER